MAAVPARSKFAGSEKLGINWLREKELWLAGTVGLYKGRSALQGDACLVDERRHVQRRRVNLGDAVPPHAHTQARNARDTQRGRRGDDATGRSIGKCF